MNHSPSPPPNDEPIKSQRYVVVRFQNQANLPDPPFSYNDISRQLQPGASPIDDSLEFDAHFGTEVSPNLKVLVQRSKERDTQYRPPNLLNYFRIEVKGEADGDSLAEKLRTWDIVEYAYLHPGAVELPVPEAPKNPLEGLQVYLEAAPMGVDAYAAWECDGGKGQDQILGDVEWGWFQNHADISGHSFVNLNDGFYRRLDHGTSVLGIIGAHDNTLGCVGIAHEVARVVTVGQWLSPTLLVSAPAVLKAMDTLESGSVLLLEAQTTMYGHVNIPLESEPDVFDVVELATKAGITVVAAAGNGGKDLDLIADYNGKLMFTSDSGAILVAAASLDTAPQWQRSSFTCFGQRVNCFAQGNRVVTLDSNDFGSNDTTQTFGGTSSASAIIAGVALAVQGVAKEALGYRLSPKELRELLSDTSLNTPAVTPSARIGMMPNLRNICGKLLAKQSSAGATYAEPQSEEESPKTTAIPTTTTQTPTQKEPAMADKTLYVKLDVSAPTIKVEVDRDVYGKSKMKWRKDSDGDDFKFKNIDFDPSDPFTITKLEDDKINVDNSMSPSGRYEYTLTVEHDGDLYNTTELGPPGPGDKPVVRN